MLAIHMIIRMTTARKKSIRTIKYHKNRELMENAELRVMILVSDDLEIEEKSCLGDLFTMADYFKCGCGRGTL